MARLRDWCRQWLPCRSVHDPGGDPGCASRVMMQLTQRGQLLQTHYTYLPSTAVGDGAGSKIPIGESSSCCYYPGLRGTTGGRRLPPGTGQFFGDRCHHRRVAGRKPAPIAPQDLPLFPEVRSSWREPQEEKRRAQHNEVIITPRQD